MKKKRILLSILLLISLFLLCSCGGPEGTYKSAPNLLSKGKYEEAAKKFESLGGYEDATTLTLYCKAVALAESGDYKNGIAGLKNLGDYKDCAMRITYYTGRYYEDLVNQGNYEYLSRAQQVYESNPLFLDSSKRAENLIPNLYAKAEAFQKEKQWVDAAIAYSALGDYQDSQEKYSDCWYEQAEELLNSENYEAASIDGATRWQTIRNIVMPLVRSSTNTIITLSLIGGLRCFDLIWAMTKGGPGFVTDVLASVVYKQYAAGFFGLSTAGNVIMFAVIAIIAFPLQKFLNSREVYN